MQIPSLGQEDPPGEGNGNPLQYSCLENSMDRSTMVLQRVGHESAIEQVRAHAHAHTHTHTLLIHHPLYWTYLFSEIVWCLSRINPLIEGWWHTPGLQGCLNI